MRLHSTVLSLQAFPLAFDNRILNIKWGKNAFHPCVFRVSLSQLLRPLTLIFCPSIRYKNLPKLLVAVLKLGIKNLFFRWQVIQIRFFFSCILRCVQLLLCRPLSLIDVSILFVKFIIKALLDVCLIFSFLNQNVLEIILYFNRAFLR